MSRELIAAMARDVCRSNGLCVGFCHLQRCPKAMMQHGETVLAVLRSLREHGPSEEMIEAGEEGIPWTRGTESRARVPNPEDTFIAMIDSLLHSTKGPDHAE